MGLKVVCIVSSVRSGRNAERMIKFVEQQFEATMKPKGHTLEIVDPEVYDLPLLKQPLHFYPDQSKAPAILLKLNEIVQNADAYLILTTEYNRSVPPALLNLMDHLPPPSFEFKPSAILGYAMGPHGAALACAAARPFLSEMGCIPVKHFTTVQEVHKEMKEDGTTDNAHIVSSITKLFTELDWWGRAAQSLRKSEGKPVKK